MNGDLLRTLEGPDSCLQPRLIQSSSEGHCVVYYEKGQFCLFSVNGKLLAHMEVEDSIKVRKRPILHQDVYGRARSHMYVCTTSVQRALALIKGLFVSEVKVSAPREKPRPLHLFFFSPASTRGNVSFDPGRCCQVGLRRRWRTFHRSGQPWTPASLTTLQRRTAHSSAAQISSLVAKAT